MRTIQFRAWDNNNSEMIFFYELSNNPEMLRDILTSGDTLSVYPMQFTGLHDKNGKEIYEGDILNVGENLVCEIVYVDKNVEDYGDEIHCAFHAKVYIHNKTIPLDSYLKNNCEIIGNIHENPELLENKLAD